MRKSGLKVEVATTMVHERVREELRKNKGRVG